MLEALALIVGYLLSKSMAGNGNHPNPPGPQPQPYPPYPYPPQPQPQPQPYPNPQPNPWPQWPSQPGPGTQGRTYTIAKDDLAYKVGERLYGQIKTPEGKWAWKEITSYVGGSIDTSGEQPVPWAAGMVLNIPPSWTADKGSMPGARGTVAQAGYAPQPQPQPQPYPPQPQPQPPKPQPQPSPGMPAPTWPGNGKLYPGTYDPNNPPAPGTYDPTNPPFPYTMATPPWQNQGVPYNPNPAISGDENDEEMSGEDEGTV